MKTLITLQELALKLNGKFWSNNGKERVYLDRGYNTKKMSTKTYVEETSEGNFNVKCFVECPSQDYNWCKSQANQVIESVDKEIAEALVTEYFYIVNEKTNEVIDDCQTVKPLVDLYVGGGLYIREGFAKNFIKREYLDGFVIKSISRVDYEALEVAPVVEEKKVNAVEQKEVDAIQKVKYELGNGKKVFHARFGLGEITEEVDGGEKLRIVFETEGEKLLLARFANLTFL